MESNKYVYEINQTFEFKKPTTYRVVYRKKVKFAIFEWLKSQENSFVTVKNGSSHYNDCFKTESKKEVLEFINWCIMVDNIK